MAPHPVPSSGVLGAAGRVAAAGPVRSADLRLAGAPLPVLGTARVYTCGITPYDVTHLGHAATFVWADALRGVLEMAGAEVVSSRNVTDVDDVLTRAADAQGRHYDEFALSQEYLFERDMDALAVHRPTHEPRARYYVTARAAADRGAAGRGTARTSGTGTSSSAGPTCPRGRAWTAPPRWSCPRRSGTSRAIRCGRTRSTSRCGAPPGRPTPRGRALGLGPSGLACRVRGDGGGDPRVVRRRPRRRRGPHVPAPRLPGRHGGGRGGGGSLRPPGAARRCGVPGRRQDGQVHRQPRLWSRTCWRPRPPRPCG